jgi:hypothetical protein
MRLGRLGAPLPPGLARRTGDATPIFAEVRPLASSPGQTGEWRAWIAGDRKLLWNSHGRSQLFDLASDPTESHSLLGEAPGEARALQAGLDAFLAALPAPADAALPATGAKSVDDETRRALEALGYLE